MRRLVVPAAAGVAGGGGGGVSLSVYNVSLRCGPEATNSTAPAIFTAATDPLSNAGEGLEVGVWESFLQNPHLWCLHPAVPTVQARRLSAPSPLRLAFCPPSLNPPAFPLPFPPPPPPPLPSPSPPRPQPPCSPCTCPAWPPTWAAASSWPAPWRASTRCCPLGRCMRWWAPTSVPTPAICEPARCRP